MLTESIAAIRALFSGELVTYRGDHIAVEDARLSSNAGDPAADRRRGQRHELAPRLAKAAG